MLRKRNVKKNLKYYFAKIDSINENYLQINKNVINKRLIDDCIKTNCLSCSNFGSPVANIRIMKRGAFVWSDKKGCWMGREQRDEIRVSRQRVQGWKMWSQPRRKRLVKQ